MNLFWPRSRRQAEQATGGFLARARALYSEGRYAEAEAEARGLAEPPFQLPDAGRAPLAMSMVALAMSAQGRHVEALATCDALLPVFGKVFGAEHEQTLVLRSNRAQTLSALGRYVECEEECAAVARTAARGVWPHRVSIQAAARNGQIYALNAQSRHEEAESLAREALAPVVPHRIAVALRLGLARSLNGQGRYEEALAEAAHADELRRTVSEELQRPETGALEVVQAAALFGLGHGSEARARAAAAHEACLAAFGPDHHRTAEARALLARMDSA